MMDLIVNNISEILITALVGLVSYILTVVGNKAKEYFNDIKVKGFVEDTVRYINQAYETLSNEEKFEQAKNDILSWLQDEGLKVTEAKLKVLIESAVNKIKKGDE